MKIYILMADVDGTMRSSCDTAERAFTTYEAANDALLRLREGRGAYAYAIQSCELELPKETT